MGCDSRPRARAKPLAGRYITFEIQKIAIIATFSKKLSIGLGHIYENEKPYFYLFTMTLIDYYIFSRLMLVDSQIYKRTES
jgi:hypothetical protein